MSETEKKTSRKYTRSTQYPKMLTLQIDNKMMDRLNRLSTKFDISRSEFARQCLEDGIVSVKARLTTRMRREQMKQNN